MSFRRLLHGLLLVGVLAAFPARAGESARGRFFLGLPHFMILSRRSVEADGAAVFASPVIDAPMEWNELVVSWNVSSEAPVRWKVEVSPRHPQLPRDRFYNLGFWATDTNLFARQSVPGQKDELALVDTDTLKTTRLIRSAVVRMTATGPGAASAKVRFVGLSMCDSAQKSEARPSDKLAWGKNIDVPLLSQLDYPGGETKWCSPTSLTMLLRYWGGRNGDASMASLTVPVTAAGVFDPNWPGTGNWPFNAAFASSFPGMRAYVSRLRDLTEVEKWIEAGCPLALSVSYNRLKGKEIGGSGHLVVCTGFTKEGDVMINDPGVALAEGHRVFPRAVVETAWAESHNTVYILHPENASSLPRP